jgi:hypothetical protein
VEDHFETFVQVYEERFEKPYGFWRPYLQKVIDRYLDCGDLHHGFARVKCRDCLGFNPHCHVLVTDGCFLRQAQDSVYERGMFRVAPPLDLKKLEAIFRHKVFKMLLAKGRITKDLIAMLSNWRHSGFQVFCGNRLGPEDEMRMENLARYIIRASFS